ncbi:acetate/propionate family kinase [Rhodobacteraceae bacterium NNCM2]|nr:acetate/propionate family kinase [Coraliihabitans acroporae]
MIDAILVMNAGSSSLKFAVYPANAAGGEAPLLRGKIMRIGNGPVLTAHDNANAPLPENRLMQIDPSAGHDELIPAILQWLRHELSGVRAVAAGHRVVHGGQHHVGPTLITAELLDELEELVPLAPQHQGHNLTAIRSVLNAVPDLPQVACFDTSFHRSQDHLAQIFALPRELTEKGIIRYGFHGLSYDYIARALPKHLGDKADGRVIVAHLGNGASLCAMKERRSVATSMGFTALDGLMMGCRCGSIDPGVLFHLINHMGMAVEEVERLLYEDSGLKGVSGISNNMQMLQDSPAPEAREAIELFCYRAAKELSGLVATIGGLDTIVFTAGIGEKSPLTRELICNRLGWLRVDIDADMNAENATRINTAASGVEVLVIPTDEESVIAQATGELLRASGADLSLSQVEPAPVAKASA